MAKVTWGATGGVDQSIISQATAVLNAASDYVNSFLARPISWDITISVDASIAPALANNQSQNISTPLFSGSNVYDTTATYQARTGAEASGPDAVIKITPQGLSSGYFNPTTSTNVAVPSGKTDIFSVFVHELTHALGFTGVTDSVTFTNTTGILFLFDQHVKVVNGSAFFFGPNTKAVYGGDVPLAKGSIFHFANGVGDLPGPYSDVMSTNTNSGIREGYSRLDLAVLADLGIATTADDILTGTAGGDNIAAGAGNDTIFASVGNDVINGGGGIDTVVYSGRRAAFTVKGGSAQPVTVTKATGIDTITNVERMRFDDAQMAFDVDGNAGMGYRMYRAAFHRTPDQGGLSFWVKQLDLGASLQNVANGFVNSVEFKATYGAKLTNAQLVDAFYQNVLNRPGEAGGVAFWNGVLNAGNPPEVVLAGFSESAENKAALAGLSTSGIALDLF